MSVLGEHLFVGCRNGEIALFDIPKGEFLKKEIRPRESKRSSKFCLFHRSFFSKIVATFGAVRKFRRKRKFGLACWTAPFSSCQSTNFSLPSLRRQICCIFPPRRHQAPQERNSCWKRSRAQKRNLVSNSKKKTQKFVMILFGLQGFSRRALHQTAVSSQTQ
jgi:hypothetical protein